MIQETIDAYFEAFIEAVARGRGMSIDAVRAVADGRTYMGEQLVQSGLVDSIGTVAEAASVARGVTVIRSGTVTGAHSHGGPIMDSDPTTTATATAANLHRLRRIQSQHRQLRCTTCAPGAACCSVCAPGAACSSSGGAPRRTKPRSRPEREERARIVGIQGIAAEAGPRCRLGGGTHRREHEHRRRAGLAYKHLLTANRPVEISVGEDPTGRRSATPACRRC